tara:strand:+ start:60017 stop:61501 length:1485 start_codon:yes stop_codon:yes gene_type:complete
VRKYTAYENVGILVGPPSGDATWVDYDNPSWVKTTEGFNELIRVQSASFGFNSQRINIPQVSSSSLAASHVNSQPSAEFAFNYFLTDSCNERLLGFYIGADRSCLYNMLNYPSEQSIGHSFLLAISDTDDREVNFEKDLKNTDVVGLGNAYMSSYDFSVSVGSFPEASVSYSCANVNFTTNENLDAGEYTATRAYLDTYFEYNGSPAPQTLVRSQYDDGQVGWDSPTSAFSDGSPSVSSHTSSTVTTSAGWSTFFAGSANNFSEFSTKPYFILRDAEGDVVIKLENYGEDKYITEIWTDSTTLVSPALIPGGSYRTGYYPSIDLKEGIHRKGYQYHISNQNFSGQIGSVSALRHGDITLSLTQSQFGQKIQQGGAEVAIQNFSLNIPFSRRSLRGLGSNYSYNEKIILPLVSNISMQLNQTEFIESNLNDIFKADSTYDFDINLKTMAGNTNMTFRMTNAKMTSQNYSYDIGGVASVQLDFTCEVNGSKGVHII